MVVVVVVCGGSVVGRQRLGELPQCLPVPGGGGKEGYHQFRIRALGPVAFCRSSGGDRMSNEQAGIPAELAEALSENETAEKILEALPSSHQNEYLRWIGEAKHAETRQRRAAKAVEMLVDKHG